MLPIPNASCGVPVTSTDLLNVTVTSIRSPRSNVSLTSGEPSVTPVTTGGPCAPSTLCAALFDIADVPNPRLAAVDPSRASLIDPPFNPSALAPTLNPSESLSAACTAYRNVSVFVPVPEA